MVNFISKNSYWNIFFDDGNVLNNNEIRGTQWKKILPEFFIPRFGGTEEIWSKANHRVINEEMEILKKRWESQERPKDFNEFWDEIMNDWVIHMFKYANVPLPNIDRIELFKDVSKYVIPQVQSANDGVQETVKLLWELGYNLYTASGTMSWEIEQYIIGMGCKDYFNNLYYGPDLINEGKFSSKYFEKIFQDVGLDPSKAIVIDDNPYFLEYAKEAGAHVIQSYINVKKRKVTDFTISNFREIPGIVDSIKNRNNLK